jgi:OFA family oxalate/formate antiporter-like MFS transporter
MSEQPLTGASPVMTVALPAARTRWVQLVLGLLCMMSISSPQYVWTLFTKPLMAKFGVALPSLQITFTLLVMLQAFLSPFQGSLIERFGARRLISVGTVMAGLSWTVASYSQSELALYLTYGVLGGLGTGIVYVGIIGLVVRWFPTNRGFAAGVAAAGYGMGAILTTFPISASLEARGVEQTLWIFGLVFAVVGFLAAQGLRMPQNAVAMVGHDEDMRPSQMTKTPVFWLMFAMMTMMATSGLMVTSQMASFAADFGITKTLVFGLAAVPLALTIDRFANGLTRPLFGYVSDRIGRERTMFFAFSLEAVAMTAWLTLRSDPRLFVLLSGVVFLGWGEIFSLFPATLTDTFGARHATANYGWLYISFGIGSLFGGPLAALLHQQTGSWLPVFAAAIALDLLAAILALFVLKPARASLQTKRISER